MIQHVVLLLRSRGSSACLLLSSSSATSEVCWHGVYAGKEYSIGEVIEAGDFKRCAAMALKALEHDKDCGQPKVGVNSQRARPRMASSGSNYGPQFMGNITRSSILWANVLCRKTTLSGASQQRIVSLSCFSRRDHHCPLAVSALVFLAVGGSRLFACYCRPACRRHARSTVHGEASPARWHACAMCQATSGTGLWKAASSMTRRPLLGRPVLR